MTFSVDKIFKQNEFDPQVEEYLKQVNAIPQPDYKNIDPAIFKIESDKRFNEVLKSKNKDEVHNITNISIDGINGSIPIRIYNPSPSKGPFPAFYFIHGGGWMTGSLDTHDNVCRAISKRAQCIVVAVDYRLSPEYKFPTGLNDASSVMEWIIKNIRNYNGIDTGIGIGGDSGGGNISAALTIKYKLSQEYRIAFQILFYPSLNLSSFDTETFKKFEEGYGLSKEKVEWYTGKYLSRNSDRYDILVSPLLNEDMKDLPPSCIATAEYDVLRDEGEEYAEKLYDSGVPVRCIRYGGLIHAFLNMDGVIDKVDYVFTDISNIIKDYFEKYV